MSARRASSERVFLPSARAPGAYSAAIVLVGGTAGQGCSASRIARETLKGATCSEWNAVRSAAVKHAPGVTVTGGYNRPALSGRLLYASPAMPIPIAWVSVMPQLDAMPTPRCTWRWPHVRIFSIQVLLQASEVYGYHHSLLPQMLTARCDTPDSQLATLPIARLASAPANAVARIQDQFWLDI